MKAKIRGHAVNHAPAVTASTAVVDVICDAIRAYRWLDSADRGANRSASKAFECTRNIAALDRAEIARSGEGVYEQI